MLDYVFGSYSYGYCIDTNIVWIQRLPILEETVGLTETDYISVFLV
jgi:hypothetical protein